MKKIARIILKRPVDPNPDLSFLKSEIRNGRVVASERYSDKDISEHGLAKVQEWVEQDRKRLGRYGEDWQMIGVQAEAEIQTSEDGNTWLCNTIGSSGLWGIESDSSEEYLRQVEAEEIESLKSVLRELGFSEHDIEAVTPVRTR